MVLRYVWSEKHRTGHSPGHRHSMRLALQAPDGKAQTQMECALLFPRHLKQMLYIGSPHTNMKRTTPNPRDPETALRQRIDSGLGKELSACRFATASLGVPPQCRMGPKHAHPFSSYSNSIVLC